MYLIIVCVLCVRARARLLCVRARARLLCVLCALLILCVPCMCCLPCALYLCMPLLLYVAIFVDLSAIPYRLLYCFCIGLRIIHLPCGFVGWRADLVIVVIVVRIS